MNQNVNEIPQYIVNKNESESNKKVREGMRGRKYKRVHPITPANKAMLTNQVFFPFVGTLVIRTTAIHPACERNMNPEGKKIRHYVGTKWKNERLAGHHESLVGQDAEGGPLLLLCCSSNRFNISRNVAFPPVSLVTYTATCCSTALLL